MYIYIIFIDLYFKGRPAFILGYMQDHDRIRDTALQHKWTLAVFLVNITNGISICVLKRWE